MDFIDPLMEKEQRSLVKALFTNDPDAFSGIPSLQEIDRQLEQDEIHRLINQKRTLSTRDQARVDLVFYLIRICQIEHYEGATRKIAYGDEIVASLHRFGTPNSAVRDIYEQAEISGLEDAKKSVRLFEKYMGVILPKSEFRKDGEYYYESQ